MATGLTAQQALFVREYLVDKNATEAAKRAGYSAKTAATQGSRLYRNVHVRAEIDQGLKEQSERLKVKADDVLQELKRLGFVDPGRAFDADGRLLHLPKMPEDIRRAIASVEVEALYEGHGEDRMRVGTTTKIKFWNKPQALELLGKNQKLFTDRLEVKVDESFADALKRARERRAQRK